MDGKIISTFISLCVIVLVHGRCPQPSQLPGIYERPKIVKFVCARVYEYCSCNGESRHLESLDILNGDERKTLTMWSCEVSSVVVRPGCWMEAFVDEYYRGISIKLTGIDSCLDNNKFGIFFNWNNHIRSWKCHCPYDNKALLCRAREETREMHVCKNRTPHTMECTWKIQTGIEFGSLVTNGHQMSKPVIASLGAMMMTRFTKEGNRLEHDWSKMNSKTFRDVTTTTVKCTAASNTTLRLKQVVGVCGDTVVHTSIYECTSD